MPRQIYSQYPMGYIYVSTTGQPRRFIQPFPCAWRPCTTISAIIEISCSPVASVTANLWNHGASARCPNQLGISPLGAPRDQSAVFGSTIWSTLVQCQGFCEPIRTSHGDRSGVIASRDEILGCGFVCAAFESRMRIWDNSWTLLVVEVEGEWQQGDEVEGQARVFAVWEDEIAVSDRRCRVPTVWWCVWGACLLWWFFYFYLFFLDFWFPFKLWNLDTEWLWLNLVLMFMKCFDGQLFFVWNFVARMISNVFFLLRKALGLRIVLELFEMLFQTVKEHRLVNLVFTRFSRVIWQKWIEVGFGRRRF